MAYYSSERLGIRIFKPLSTQPRDGYEGVTAVGEAVVKAWCHCRSHTRKRAFNCGILCPDAAYCLIPLLEYILADEVDGLCQRASCDPDPTLYPLVLPEPACAITKHPQQRERLAEVLFENPLRVPAISFGPSPVFSLIGSLGVSSGVVVDSGASHTDISLVADGRIVTDEEGSQPQCLPIGGNELVDYFQRIVCERGYEMTTTREREILEDCRLKIGYVALDYVDSLYRAEESGDCEFDYELPDGSTMTIGSERFRASEVLFKPTFLGLENEGLSETLNRFVRKPSSSTEFRHRDILCCGGTSQLRGFRDRLTADLLDPTRCGNWEYERDQPKPNLKTREFVLHEEKKQHSAWIGASMMARAGLLGSAWVTRKEYEEVGPSVVSRSSLFVDAEAARDAFTGVNRLERDRVFEFLIEKMLPFVGYQLLDELRFFKCLMDEF